MKQIFEIIITSYKNFTWQGMLRAQDGTEVPFESEMEFLMEMDRLLAVQETSS